MIARLLISFALFLTPLTIHADITGAWEHVRDDGAVGTMIVTDGHFSIAWYETEPARFIYTSGGTWSPAPEGVEIVFEYHTDTPDLVGQTGTNSYDISGDRLRFGEMSWTRIDDGAPGALEGAWLMTGRKRDGEISTRRPGVRRTMKILSGTRFQWIAYNVETKEFFGSGGGTYTTEDGTYTENIEFFSRDDARAGMNLQFGYALEDGVWHHDGKSTSGEPMYELWNLRKDLGI